MYSPEIISDFTTSIALPNPKPLDLFKSRKERQSLSFSDWRVLFFDLVVSKAFARFGAYDIKHFILA